MKQSESIQVLFGIVQKLAGHASPVTTAKYDRRGEEVKRRAVQRLSFTRG